MLDEPKGRAKYLDWFDRVNKIRRVFAHSYGGSLKRKMRKRLHTWKSSYCKGYQIMIPIHDGTLMPFLKCSGGSRVTMDDEDDHRVKVSGCSPSDDRRCHRPDLAGSDADRGVE
jgi:hypothetical protein